jgi:hypothetical protein
MFQGLDVSGSPVANARTTGKLNPFSKQRRGEGGKLVDPVKAAEAYVRNAEAEIASHQPTMKLNSLIDALKERGDVPQQHINWLEQQRDIVAGQGHRVDRAINSTQLGKAGLTTVSAASKQAGRNLIGLNPTSILTQPAQLVQSGAKMGWRNTLKSLTAPLKDKELTAESQFLRGRHAHLDKIAPGLTERLVNASLKPIEVAQRGIDDIIYQAAKHRAGELGLKGQKALDWADAATKETVAARGTGQTPHMYTSKVGNAVGQFSLEMGNSLHQLAADELRHGRIGGITSYAIGAYGFNQAFNWITGKATGRPGGGVLLDPIQAGVDTYDNAKEGNYIQAAGRIPGEILANAPGGQMIAAGVKAINPKVGDQLFGQAGAGRYGVGVPAVQVAQAGANILKKPWDAAAFATPTAGVPIKRGIEGIMAVANGEVRDKNGKLMYKPAPTPQNFIRAGLFGRGTTDEGRAYAQAGKTVEDVAKDTSLFPGQESKSSTDKTATSKSAQNTRDYYGDVTLTDPIQSSANRVASTRSKFTPDLSQQSKDILIHYARLTAAGKKAFDSNIDNKIAYQEAQVEAGLRTKVTATKTPKLAKSKSAKTSRAKSTRLNSASFKTATTKAPTIKGISVKKLATPKTPSLKKLSVTKIPSSATTRKLA